MNPRFMQSLSQLGKRFNGRDRLRDGLSGHERNKLFLNSGGQFFDLSGVSGCDHPGDGRAVVRFDYDRDGRLDLAIANSNEPRFVLFHNETPHAGNFIVIDVVGEAKNGSSSNRDGIGARIEALLPDGRLLVRELRCGEGYASQQSRYLHLGLGTAPHVERMSVRWPSGRESVVTNVSSGSLITVTEGQKEAKISDWRTR